MRTMVLEYLATKLGHFGGKCWDSYSSTMVRIWVIYIYIYIYIYIHLSIYQGKL